MNDVLVEWMARCERLEAQLTSARKAFTESAADLAAARDECDKWKNAYMVRCQLADKDTNDAVSPVREDLIAARAECARLREVLEKVYPLIAGQPAQWITDALRIGIATGPAEQQQSIAMPRVATTPAPVVPLADTEALVSVAESVIHNGGTCSLTMAQNALAAYRAHHPAPKDPTP